LHTTGIKLSKFGTHTLRHSFACYAYYTVGMPLDELKNVLGHEDINTTQKYLHYFEVLTRRSAEKVSKSINQDKKKAKRFNKKV
jgi:integrase